MFADFRPLAQISRNYLFFGGEGDGVTYISLAAMLERGGTHITSDMCAGIHISRGCPYHCDISNPLFSSVE